LIGFSSQLVIDRIQTRVAEIDARLRDLATEERATNTKDLSG